MAAISRHAVLSTAGARLPWSKFWNLFLLVSYGRHLINIKRRTPTAKRQNSQGENICWVILMQTEANCAVVIFWLYDVNKRVVQNETISLIFAFSNYIVRFFFLVWKISITASYKPKQTTQNTRNWQEIKSKMRKPAESFSLRQRQIVLSGFVWRTSTNDRITQMYKIYVHPQGGRYQFRFSKCLFSFSWKRDSSPLVLKPLKGRTSLPLAFLLKFLYISLRSSSSLLVSSPVHIYDWQQRTLTLYLQNK